MWLPPTALASETTCVDVGAVRPDEGETVPPETRVYAEVSLGPVELCGVRSVDVQLRDASGASVPVAVERVDGLVVVSPVDRLAPGTYVVGGIPDGTGGFAPWTRFLVAEGADGPRLPTPEVSVEAERSCVGALSTRLAATASFAFEPPGWGLVTLTFLSEGGAVGSTTRLWYGQSSIRDDLGFFGGREACVEVATEAWDGEVRFVDPVCAERFDGCPDEGLPSDEPTGCGCDTPGRPAPAAVLLLLAARRRRGPC